MPKAEAGTPKAIANKMKAKGLQKLRWYCQMCQKQCRDENGFKCHTMSESHQRQLLLFADNPHKFLGTFSKEFKDSFVYLLKTQFGTKRVYANQVYQDYIHDRNHVHMNSTQWETLTGFVKWLGRNGICVVDQTEKGWFITYIDRDPETIQRQEAVKKKKKMDLDDEERIAKFVQKQVKKAKTSSDEPDDTEYKEFTRENEEEKVTFSLGLPVSDKKESEMGDAAKKLMPPPNEIFNQKHKSKRHHEFSDKNDSRKKSTLSEIMNEQEKHKEKKNRKNYWLTEGIVVKLISKKLGEKYYKKKAVVLEVIEYFMAKVKVLDSNDILKIDQIHAETVIPACGRLVKLVNGAYRGEEGILQSLNVDNFCATVKISTGLTKGRIIEKIAYEDLSKVHLPS